MIDVSGTDALLAEPDTDRAFPSEVIEESPLPRDVTPERALPSATRVTDIANEEIEYKSPAFLKRARISYGSLFEDGFDIFAEEDEADTGGRKRAKFGRASNAWRYSSRSRSPEREPTPEPTTGQVDMRADETPAQLTRQGQNGVPVPPSTTQEFGTLQSPPGVDQAASPLAAGPVFGSSSQAVEGGPRFGLSATSPILAFATNHTDLIPFASQAPPAVPMSDRLPLPDPGGAPYGDQTPEFPIASYPRETEAGALFEVGNSNQSYISAQGEHVSAAAAEPASFSYAERQMEEPPTFAGQSQPSQLATASPYHQVSIYAHLQADDGMGVSGPEVQAAIYDGVEPTLASGVAQQAIADTEASVPEIPPVDGQGTEAEPFTLSSSASEYDSEEEVVEADGAFQLEKRISVVAETGVENQAQVSHEPQEVAVEEHVAHQQFGPAAKELVDENLDDYEHEEGESDEDVDDMEVDDVSLNKEAQGVSPRQEDAEGEFDEASVEGDDEGVGEEERVDASVLEENESEGGDYDTRNYADVQDDQEGESTSEDGVGVEMDGEVIEEDELYGVEEEASVQYEEEEEDDDDEEEEEEEEEESYDEEEYSEMEEDEDVPPPHHQMVPVRQASPIFISLLSDSEDEEDTAPPKAAPQQAERKPALESAKQDPAQEANISAPFPPPGRAVPDMPPSLHPGSYPQPVVSQDARREVEPPSNSSQLPAGPAAVMQGVSVADTAPPQSDAKIPHEDKLQEEAVAVQETEMEIDAAPQMTIEDPKPPAMSVQPTVTKVMEADTVPKETSEDLKSQIQATEETKHGVDLEMNQDAFEHEGNTEEDKKEVPELDSSMLDEQLQADVQHQYQEESVTASQKVAQDVQPTEGSEAAAEPLGDKHPRVLEDSRDDGARGMASPPLTQQMEAPGLRTVETPTAQVGVDGTSHDGNDLEQLPTPGPTQVTTSIFGSQLLEEPIDELERTATAQPSSASKRETRKGVATRRSKRHETPAEEEPSLPPPRTSEPAAQDEAGITVKSLRSKGHRRKPSDRSDASFEESSLLLARAPRSTRSPGAKGLETPTTRARTRNAMMSRSPDPEEDTSIILAKASLNTPPPNKVAGLKPSVRTNTVTVEEKTSAAALKARLNEKLLGLDLIALRSLRSHTNQKVNVLGVAIKKPEDAKRHKKGSRNYRLDVTITDQSEAPLQATIVHIYRPHKQALPEVQAGDVMLLQGFQVFGVQKDGFGLMSAEESAWALYERAHPSEPPQIKGRPMEPTEEEHGQAALLLRWYAALTGKAKEKLEKATERLEAAVQASSQPA